MLVFPYSTLAEEYAHIYSGDPAVDRSTDEAKEAFRLACERNDASKIPIVEGQTPTMFYLRHPTGDLLRWLKDRLVVSNRRDDGHYRFGRQAVALCLMRVSDGDLDMTRTRNQPGFDGFDALKPETMDVLERVDGGNLVDELGVRILLEMQPDPLA